MEKKHIFDNPENVKKLLRYFFSCVIFLLVLDVAFHYLVKTDKIHPHMNYVWEGYFGFYAFYGFVACVILVLISRYILRPLVKRKEDYYDK